MRIAEARQVVLDRLGLPREIENPSAVARVDAALRAAQAQMATAFPHLVLRARASVAVTAGTEFVAVPAAVPIDGIEAMHWVVADVTTKLISGTNPVDEGRLDGTPIYAAVVPTQVVDAAERTDGACSLHLQPIPDETGAVWIDYQRRPPLTGMDGEIILMDEELVILHAVSRLAPVMQPALVPTARDDFKTHRDAVERHQGTGRGWTFSRNANRQR